MFVSLPFWLYIALLNSNAQTFLTEKLSNFIKKEYGLNVSIKKINFRPVNTIILDKVYIEDFYGDTLIYVDHLDAGINWISLAGPALAFDHLLLDSVKYYMVTDSTGVSNITRFIETFETNDTLPPDSPDFKLYARNVNVKSAEVKIQDYNPEQIKEMNYSDMHFSKANASIKSLRIIGSDLNIDIKNLSTVEKCGIDINKLSTIFKYDTEGIKLEQLHVGTGKTNLLTNFVRMLFLTDDPYEDFVSNVAFEADFLQSTISSDDLKFFATDIDTLNANIVFEGDIKGVLNDLSSDKFLIFTGKATRIKTTFNIKNLIDFDRFYINASITDFYTTSDDLNTFDFFKNREGSSILPAELSAFKIIQYTGEVNGSILNFKTNGKIITNIGKVLLNGSVQQLPDSSYKTQFYLTTDNFDIASVLKANEQNTGLSEMFGHINGEININGSFLSDETFSAQLKTNIKTFDFYNYNYQNINIDGLVTDKFFDGEINIVDPNIEFDFTGKAEYGTKELNHRFLLNFSRLNLYNLGLDTDTTSSLQFEIIANMQGIDPDEMRGDIQLLDTYISRNNNHIHLPSLNINIDRSLTAKKAHIKTNLFDISINGQYSYNNISATINDIVKTYIPKMAWNDKELPPDDSTSINVKIKMIDIQPVVRLFDSTLKISNSSFIELKYTAPTKQLIVKSNLQQIAYGSLLLDTVEINGYNQRRRIIANVKAKRFNYIEGESLKNFSVSSVIADNTVELNATWNNYNTDTVNYSGFINTRLTPPDSINKDLIIDIFPSHIIISDIVWKIEPSVVKINDEHISIEDFSANSFTQKIEINGKLSDKEQDSINVNIKEIDLEIINTVLQDKIDLKFGGRLTANVSARNVFNNPFFLAQIQLDTLQINDNIIGNTTVSSKWDPLLEMVHVDWVSTIDNYNALYIAGDYDPLNYNMNFRLFADRFDMSILNPYVEGVLHDLSGLATAELIIKGKPEAPKLEGTVFFDRTSFTIDYSQTRYQITDWIDISPNELSFDDFRISDVNNNFVLITGKLQHQNFDNIKMYIDINSHNFMFLNTLEKDNDYFYGTAFLTGNGKVQGNLELLDISLNIRTDPNTRVFVPLNKGATVNTVSYITFVEPEKQKIIFSEPDESKQTLSSSTSIKLTMNIEATPEAEIQVIFDPTIGDIITIKGASNLNLFMSPSGVLEIYGDYIISTGNYLFTLQNIFQKRLNIAQGSSITWSGDPFEARIDIDAVYKVKRASLYDLTLSQDDEETHLAADAHLLVTGSFDDPKINFGITLPSSAEQAQEQLTALSTDDLSKQVISLLVLGRFQPLQGASRQASNTVATGAIESNASELLSNQVSNWLSQISKSFDIGFNYTPEGETTTQEYELAVSTQILNNRLTINGSAGTGGEQINSAGGSNVAGDIEMELKIDKRGKFRIKGYTKTNEDIDTDADTRQGASIFYKEEFNTFKELWQKFFGPSKTDNLSAK